MCKDESIAKNLLAQINSKMSVDLKYLGSLDRFKRINILQTKQYINIHNKTFINKILKNHTWMKAKYQKHQPLPMTGDLKYLTSLEQAKP